MKMYTMTILFGSSSIETHSDDSFCIKLTIKAMQDTHQAAIGVFYLCDPIVFFNSSGKIVDMFIYLQIYLPC